MKGKKLQPAVLPTTPNVEREQRASKLPRFNGGTLQATPDQLDETCDLFKTSHEDVAFNIIEKSLQGTVHADSPMLGDCFNEVLQQFSELKPESYLESMLLAQMIQVSNAAAKCMERAFLKDQAFVAKGMYANLAIKFQRTFVAQIEALQKLRGKGGQKVTVEHVHVHEGGQAIVGNVNQAPGGRGKDDK